MEVGKAVYAHSQGWQLAWFSSEIKFFGGRGKLDEIQPCVSHTDTQVYLRLHFPGFRKDEILFWTVNVLCEFLNSDFRIDINKGIIRSQKQVF